MKKIKKKLYKSKEAIQCSVSEVAKKINKDYKKEEEILFIIIMKGGMFLAVDLLKKIKVDLEIDFVFSKSYEKEEKIGKPQINYLETINPENKKIILVDDLIDTGETLKAIIDLLNEKNPKSIAVVTIFNNPDWEYKNVKKYYVFKKKNKKFVIGYGLDYEEKLRNLPYISIIK